MTKRVLIFDQSAMKQFNTVAAWNAKQMLPLSIEFQDDLRTKFLVRCEIEGQPSSIKGFIVKLKAAGVNPTVYDGEMRLLIKAERHSSKPRRKGQRKKQSDS